MRRVIAAFRLLLPRDHKPGPFRPESDGVVSPEAVGDFLGATYIAAEKLRAFGLSDEDFGGPIRIAQREPGEKANGRYVPKTDTITLFHPPLRGAPDLPWTIIHETMHRVWFKHIDKKAMEFWETLCDSTGKPFDPLAAEALAKTVQKDPNKSNLWFYFNKHFGNDLGLFKLWLTQQKISPSFPSQYASTDPAEAFAEAAACVILGRGHAGREIKRTGSMVRKVFLCMVGPLRHKDSGSKLSEDLMQERQYQDENFLQTQVDFGYMRAILPRWVRKNIRPEEVLKMEHRPRATVYYGADRRDLPRIDKIIQEYGRPIRVSLGALNIFEHEDRDVLYIELIGDSLIQLHNRIAKLPHSRPQTHANYIPHMTLAYLKKGAGRRYVGQSPLKMVMSSRGVTIIDANSTERLVRTIPVEELEREPLLMANSRG